MSLQFTLEKRNGRVAVEIYLMNCCFRILTWPTTITTIPCIAPQGSQLSVGARIETWPAQAVPQEAAELPHVVAQNVDKN